MNMNYVLYDYIVNKRAHRVMRHKVNEVAEEYSRLGLSPEERMSRRFEYLCAEEKPVLLPGEKICMLRTVENIPEIFTDEEWKEIKMTHYIHERGYHSNLTVDYASILSSGLGAFRNSGSDNTARSFDALSGLCRRYIEEAHRNGREDIAAVLDQVTHGGARSFLEALQLMRIVNFALWLEGNYHNTLGRFDRYMYPYFKKDMENGKINRTEALALIEEFFLSLNRDSDLYPGIQQGDDGQSLMLGGRNADGTDGFNELSEICLEASRNLKLIDPKINVRVNNDTPENVYTKCSELTKVGLGFPQYSNDDIVIPGLEKLGYAPEDAVEYTVAACWEFIIPHLGADVPNIGALSLPKVIDVCLHRDLAGCRDFDEFCRAVERETAAECDAICSGVNNMWFVPSPILDVLMNYPDGKPVYMNYGIHGVGLSTAADSLTAIKEHIFDKKDVEVSRLIYAMDHDFESDPELLHLLRYETPKLGSGNPAADENLILLMKYFSGALDGRHNDKGGIWRAGTGSAMFYLWSADELGASPDGRRKGEPFAANYSVSLFARPDGPFSVLRSMTAPNLKECVNGGPLTVEFHSSMFGTEEAVKNVGRFVRQFVLMGGHQLQLNAVNADVLRDAQKHPENYPLLIVRIWGWSAYFVELDKCYQDHVIARQEYVL